MYTRSSREVMVLVVSFGRFLECWWQKVRWSCGRAEQPNNEACLVVNVTAFCFGLFY